MNTNKIIEKAKESYDRYFKDAPVLPDNHEQDVVCNTEEIEKIIEKKKAQLDGHVENLNAIIPDEFWYFFYEKFIHTISHCKRIHLYMLFTIEKILLSSCKFLIMIQL